MRRGLFVVLVVSLLLAGAGTAGAQSALAGEEIDPDDVLLSIAVDERGHAEWTVEYRTRLDTNESERAFEEYRADLESDPGSHEERIYNRMNATVTDASAATGREMALRNVSVIASRETLPQEYGVVTYTFEWTQFAAVDGDRLVVGDAVSGLFLDEETSLLVQWPAGYALVDATPDPAETRDRSAVWDGPADFASGEPRLTVAPRTGLDEGDGAGDDGSAIPSALPLVAGLLAVLGGVGAAALATRGGVSPFGDGGGDAATSTDDPGPTDDELLDNDEQVLRLVAENGGRMKQADVAEELGWTGAKTSQVTKRLREEGELNAFRLGRENVLELPVEENI